jgi:hypothetical protein
MTVETGSPMSKRTQFRTRRAAWPLAALMVIGMARCRAPQEQRRFLIASDLVFEAAADAEERFTAMLAGGNSELAAVLKRDEINTLIPGKKWTGRVREKDVSRQALFSVDNMRIACKMAVARPQRFHFSIYHPHGSSLSYLIHLERRGKKELVFQERLERERFLSSSIELPASPGTCGIILETRGRGVGAWVNPQLVEVKAEPRIVVIIIMDAVRADHTSPYGYPRGTTPQLQLLAADSRVFRNAYSTSSWTLPAHVSLFSGKDVLGHGVQGPSDRIGEGYPLLAEAFQKHGFITAAFTGGGFVGDHFGFHRGFQVYSNRPGGVFLRNSSSWVLENFKGFAEAFWGRDMFIFLHTYQAHAPYNFPNEFKTAINPGLRANALGPGNFLKDRKSEYFKPIAAEDRQTLVDLYDTAIFYLDKTLVAGVVGYLKEKGAYKRSTIVVASDHGEEFYEHGGWEHGHSLYNEIIRIPLVIKFPENRDAGSDDGLVSIADIPAMLLERCGLGAALDLFPAVPTGKDRVLALLFPVSPVIAHIPPKVSFVDRRFHFIHNIIDRNALAVFSPPPRNLEPYELYERGDVKEVNNLVGRRPAVLKEYHARLRDLLRRLRQMSQAGRELDKALEDELKSLGYLRD